VVVHSSSVLGSPRGENRGLFLVFKVEFTFLFDFLKKNVMKIVGLTIKIMMIINTLIYNRLQRFFFRTTLNSATSY
jgi:hypothetical protein